MKRKRTNSQTSFSSLVSRLNEEPNPKHKAVHHHDRLCVLDLVEAQDEAWNVSKTENMVTVLSDESFSGQVQLCRYGTHVTIVGLQPLMIILITASFSVLNSTTERCGEKV